MRALVLLALFAGCSGALQDPPTLDGGAAGPAGVIPDADSWAGGDGYASLVAGAGDVDGDGYADLLVADAAADVVEVWFGGASGITAARRIELSGDAGDTTFGTGIAGGGDLNGDGYDDVVVGSPDWGTGGQVYLYYGGPGGPPTVADWTFAGRSGGVGAMISLDGDVNGDGLDDLIFAGPFGHGAPLRIFHGAPAGIATTSTTHVEVEDRGGTIESFRHAGDLDGDGYGDLAFGCALCADGAGTVEIYYGSASGLDITPTFVDFPGEHVNTRRCVGQAGFGQSVAAAGDLDGDGFDDLLVGAPQANECDGALYVYRGSADGLDLTSAVELPVGAGGFGWSIAGRADFDHDARPDAVVASPGDGVGAVYLLSGTAGAFASTPLQVLAGGGASFGISVALLGDADGDGCDDVAVAQGDYDGVADGHGVSVYYSDCDGGWAPDADGDGWTAEEWGGYDCDDTDPGVRPWDCHDPDDLVVRGRTVEVSGASSWRGVWIVEGGEVRVAPYAGSAATGQVELTAEVVYVDPTAKLTATGAGFRGGAPGSAGEGPGGGGADATSFGGGGGFGGEGAPGLVSCRAPAGAGGATYGSDTGGELHRGSGGGAGVDGAAFVGRGGRGGGAVGIVADRVVIEGAIVADGLTPRAERRRVTGGSGAGGAVQIVAGELACTGRIAADGGDAGWGGPEGAGGAGGGGRIELAFTSGSIDGCTVTADAGRAGCSTAGASPGTVSVTGP